jgi:caffeoyl-CoA O-methyltransferase
MAFIVDENVEAYAEAHTTPSGELFERLAAETREKTTSPQMMVGEIEGRFLEFLVRVSHAARVLEIGTFTGYSSISMASVLPTSSRLITCDIEEKAHAAARRHAEQAGVVDRIDYRLGPALDTIEALDGPFDLVFIDADKPNYANYYDAVLPKLSRQGIIAVDNTLWSGRVLDPTVDDEGSVAIKAFNDRVMADDRVVSVLLTVRDGVTLIRKA